MTNNCPINFDVMLYYWYLKLSVNCLVSIQVTDAAFPASRSTETEVWSPAPIPSTTLKWFSAKHLMLKGNLGTIRKQVIQFWFFFYKSILIFNLKTIKQWQSFYYKTMTKFLLGWLRFRNVALKEISEIFICIKN